MLYPTIMKILKAGSALKKEDFINLLGSICLQNWFFISKTFSKLYNFFAIFLFSFYMDTQLKFWWHLMDYIFGDILWTTFLVIFYGLQSKLLENAPGYYFNLDLRLTFSSWPWNLLWFLVLCRNKRIKSKKAVV